MIKKIIVSICVLLSISTFAQRGTSSAYSFYGIGETKFKGTSENRSMGGVSIFPDSIHVNLQNPAGYGGLKFTTFSVSGSYNNTESATNFGTGKSQNSSIDYLMLGVPLSPKWSAGVGLMAYSAVGYRIQTVTEGNFATSNQFKGNGGVNRVFLGSGYQINSNLRVGANVDYNFGEIKTSGLEFLQTVQYGTQELNISQVSGFTFNAGAMWDKKVTAKHKVFLSLNYTPESTLDFTNSRTVSTVQFSGLSDPFIIDEQKIEVADTKIKLPSKVAFGAGFGQEQKWLLGAEFTLSQSSSMQNRFEDISNASFENGKKIAVGGYYIPQFNSYSSYFKRVTYRAGLRYENTGLVVNNKSIEDAAVTVGLGLPVIGSFSNVNLGFEYGRKGTKYADLVRENYINFTVSLSLNDKWFVKRKYY
ncbi:membrane protein [Flavobacterium antarcticum]|uniref:membrane protein n=1 Tax=Flavobacterium antarcticum TaxID=271155 RepID=UPI0003B38C7B|nr:membrane protein [Flavobacterium antarcticum]